MPPTASLPLVSVVTPCYNMAGYLGEALDSVFAQDYPNIELIVADGGSTDGSLDLLRGYGDRLRWTSEPDRGPCDAAAKGLTQARGEILVWLNADDSFLPGAVGTAVEYLRSHAEADVVYGEGWWIDEHGARIDRYPTLPFDPRRLERECFICQPAAFIRANAYRRVPLDPAIHRSFDYDLWIRMAKAGMRFASIPQYLANSRMHRGSKTIYEREEVFQASMQLLMRHYGYIPMPWVFGYTAWRMDKRDQFFDPLQPSLAKYLSSLPLGLKLNREKRLRFFAEWLATPVGAAVRTVRTVRG